MAFGVTDIRNHEPNRVGRAAIAGEKVSHRATHCIRGDPTGIC